MPKVILKFDKEKDLFNIWETCNKDSSWYDFKKTLPSVFLKICEGKKFNESKKELENHKRKMYSSGLIEIFIKTIQEAWNKINDEFFKRLEKIMKRPIYINKFTGYITTNIRCPYNEKESFFMISFFRDILSTLKTIGHEIMHLQFHKYYWEDIEKKIGKEKTSDLKEALTVLLNLEFRDLWFIEDEGYESHEKLREFITRMEKRKGF